MHVIAAKAVGFHENLKPEWRAYARDVKANAKTLANTLIDRGYKLVGNGTTNHMVLLDLHDKSYTGEEANNAIGRAGMVANKNAIPNDPRPPKVTSGLRLGSPALTSRGMGEAEFIKVGNMVADILDDIANTSLQDRIRSDVKALCEQFIIYEKAIY